MLQAPERPTPGPRDSSSPPFGGSGVTTALVLIIAIGALYLGRGLFVPFALAVLLSFALAPLVRRLIGFGLGRVLSVALAVLVAFSVIGTLAAVVGSQLGQLAANLPGYEHNIRQKIQSLKPEAGGGVLGRAANLFQELRREIEEPDDAAAEPEAGPPPMPVEIRAPPATPVDVIARVAVPLLAPVVQAGLVIVFAIFMLLERNNLRDRFIALVGRGEMYVTTEALDEAAQRVSRYLLMQLVVNATYGIPLALGLWLIGVPNALLWGVLAVLLRFLPYVGPFIAALFPIALAFAVDPGWSTVLWTVALIAVLELISNNLIEPWLYGASTGISAIAVILSAIFWTTLWGPVGLFLATPLTVCVAVIGRYVPALRFFDVLLGAEPVLAPEERLYQRALAGDAYECEQIAAAYLKEKPFLAFCDEIALPALRLAERDRERGALSAERQAVVTETLLQLAQELVDYDEPETPGRPERARPASGPTVLCIGGRSGLDMAAASLAAQALERRGVPARIAPREALSAEALGAFGPQTPDVVGLLYLAASAPGHARSHCRRLRNRLPKAQLVVALLHAAARPPPGAPAAGDTPADAIGYDFAGTVAAIERLAHPALDAPMEPAPIPPSEPERLAAVKRLDLGSRPIPALEQITRELAEAFGAPIALVSLIDEAHQRWPGACGLPSDLDAARAAPRETSVCGHVVAADQPLVIEDVLKDKRFANNPFLRERGIRFYAGEPLRTKDGQPVGSLCIIDTKPRTVTKSEAALLRALAEKAMAEIERGGARDGPPRPAAAAKRRRADDPAAGHA